MTALADLQADAKTLLGLAQVLSLFGVTLQVRARPTRQRFGPVLQLRLKSYCVRAHARQISIPSPFRELQSLFGFLSLDFLAALNSVAQQKYVSIGGHANTTETSIHNCIIYFINIMYTGYRCRT